MKLDYNYNIEFDELKDIETQKSAIDNKSVLFVIDMNNGFAKKGALYSDRVEGIIPNVVRIVESFIRNGNPVIALTDSHKKNAAEFISYPEHCLENSIEAELVDELKLYEKDIKVIRKNSTNGFLEQETQQQIKLLVDKGYQNWFIVGCCTDICIKFFATTLKCYFNSKNLNLNVTVPINAVETYDSPQHNANAMNLFSLMDMKLNGVQLVYDIE